MLRTLRTLALIILAPLALASAQADVSSPLPPARAFNLGPGDIVRVKIWREKDLNGEFQVDEVGRLTLPLLGPIIVTGIPWVPLRDSLLALYAKELKAPAVTLTPLRRVYVLGEVMKPGMFLADPTISIAGLVAMAGGATPMGDMHRIRVVRHGSTAVDNGSIETQLLADIQSDDQIFVDQRSWFARNSTFVTSAAISIASIIVALVR